MVVGRCRSGRERSLGAAERRPRVIVTGWRLHTLSDSERVSRTCSMASVSVLDATGSRSGASTGKPAERDDRSTQRGCKGCNHARVAETSMGGWPKLSIWHRLSRSRWKGRVLSTKSCMAVGVGCCVGQETRRSLPESLALSGLPVPACLQSFCGETAPPPPCSPSLQPKPP